MTAIKQIEDALKAIRSSSLIIGNLPERPNYSGSVLLIDDDEAERISVDLDSAADNMREVLAHIKVQDAEIARLREALEKLIRGYINTLENGRDRILQLGGKCDSLEQMERSDPYLLDVRTALAKNSKG